MTALEILREAEASLSHARARLADVRRAIQEPDAAPALYLDEARVLAVHHSERAAHLLKNLSPSGGR